MRRFPSCWNSTLAKLGFKLKRKPTKRNLYRCGGYGRRSSLEQLESRELLSGTPWADNDLALADFDGDGNQDRLTTAAPVVVGGVETWTLDTKASAAAGMRQNWKVTRFGAVPASGLPTAAEILIGDFNGDGRDDILSRTSSSLWYMIQSRASTAPATYQGEFIISLWGTVSTVGGWSTPVVGDFNGDGRDDVAAFNDSNPADKQWQVLTSTGTGFIEQATWASQMTVTPTAGTVMAGDFNGDGRDDLWFKKSSTAWTIAISDGSRFNVFDPSPAISTTWVPARKGDFDGDNADELLGWNSTAARWETLRFNDQQGMSLDTNWDNALMVGTIIQSFRVADANRDGRDDLVVFNATNGLNKWQVALSQQLADGTNSFVFQAAAGDGTNDWDRWFKDWDWGPSAKPYAFLNVDAPYQKLLDIFSDIYNTVELELYPGLMKGIEATAQTKAGNDWDQAALLVDRLEAAGFDADIAFGTVTVKAQQAALWIGTTPVGTAFNVGAAAYNVIRGTVDANATLLADGRVRFKHAWVRAKVPTTSGFQIVDIDPSWKFKDRQNGEVVDLTPITTNYTPVLGRDQRGTFDEFGYLANAGTNQLPVEWYEDQVMRYLVDGGKNKSLSDVSYDGLVIQKRFDSIPAGWNGDLTIDNPAGIESFDHFAHIASSLSLSARFTHRATISVEGGPSTSVHREAADTSQARQPKFDHNYVHTLHRWACLAQRTHQGNHRTQRGVALLRILRERPRLPRDGWFRQPTVVQLQSLPQSHRVHRRARQRRDVYPPGQRPVGEADPQ